MRKTLLAGIAALGFGISLFAIAPTARAADDKEFKGVLIDQHCAAKFTSKEDPEKDAAAHPKACCMKCTKDGSGFSLISGKKEMKLDDASTAKAKEYFEKNESTKVMVKGTEKDGTITVSSIEEQK